MQNKVYDVYDYNTYHYWVDLYKVQPKECAQFLSPLKLPQ